MKNIVLLWGGSGISHLLKAFCQEQDYTMKAIVAMSDSWGSTGVIREDYSVPALGDLVKNLAALWGEKTAWMTHRYQSGFLSWHTTGNIWLLGLIQTYGFVKWIDYAHNFLGYSRHRIIPSTYECNDINITTDSWEICGESAIIQNEKLSHNIQTISLRPYARASEEAQEALKTADIIIIGPGTLYSSIIACLLPSGITDAIKNSNAKKCYIANAANFPPWHCDNYNLQDYLDEIKKFTGVDWFDFILAHDWSQIPLSDQIDVDGYKTDNKITITNVLATPTEEKGGKLDSIKRNTLRHDGTQVVRWIKKIFH